MKLVGDQLFEDDKITERDCYQKCDENEHYFYVEPNMNN